jgi:hypothetical protein
MHETKWPNKIRSFLPPERQNLAIYNATEAYGIVEEMKKALRWRIWYKMNIR